MQEFMATKTGFYGKRYERGDTFGAPDDFEASWAKPVGEVDFDPESEVEEPAFLDRSIPDIIADIPKLTDASLKQAIDAETAGQKRGSLIAALDDAITNRAGSLDGDGDGDGDGEDVFKGVDTHAAIDKIATDEGVTFDAATRTVAAKIEAVKAARLLA